MLSDELNAKKIAEIKAVIAKVKRKLRYFTTQWHADKMNGGAKQFKEAELIKTTVSNISRILGRRK